MFARLACVALCLGVIATSFAAEPPPAATEAWPPQIVRKLPPPMKEPLETAQLDRVRQMALNLRNRIGPSPSTLNDDYFDLVIFPKALEYAVDHGEFFDVKKSPGQAEAIAKAAEARLNKIAAGDGSWKTGPGLVARGYRSKLDNSVQPYGLVIPAGLDLAKPVPLYVWLHGRSDTMCDLQFLYHFTGTKPPGSLNPPNAIVLHPFGRFCNGFKSAGEVDVLEAIEDVKQKYKIDENRIVLAGFSMGGAGAWHMGAHYADHWCAVHAGAGFVDVRRYQNIMPDALPSPVEQKLWGLYDVPDYRRNLLNVPLLAYSGEEDKQKAAADIMEAELATEGLKLTHLIGPKMGHKYDPEVLKDIHGRLAKLVETGRNPLPMKVSLQTKTLRYNQMFWVSALGLQKHWEESRIDADATNPRKIVVTTKNIAAFELRSPQAGVPEFAEGTTFVVDGEPFALPARPAAEPASTERSKDAASVDLREANPQASAKRGAFFVRRARGWTVSDKLPYDYQPGNIRRKIPGLQGPIDDAVMEAFVVNGPPAASDLQGVDRWAAFEYQHFVERWKLLMRGEPQVAKGGEVDKNLLLWGRPQTNPAIAAMLSRLPLVWNANEVGLGNLRFDPRKVVPMLIYPHPDNPTKYVVINGGLTFRESHDRTNSLQNPKLGDWAFIDITEPPTDEAPGKVLATGFFDEQWQYVPAK